MGSLKYLKESPRYLCLAGSPARVKILTDEGGCHQALRTTVSVKKLPTPYYHILHRLAVKQFTHQ